MGAGRHDETKRGWCETSLPSTDTCASNCRFARAIDAVVALCVAEPEAYRVKASEIGVFEGG